MRADVAIEGTPAYQSALGDILRTLGRAPFDLHAILHTIISQATRLCNAERGFIYLLGEGFSQPIQVVKVIGLTG